MKRLLVLLMMFGIMAGICSVFVQALDISGNTTVNGTIDEQVSIQILPDVLNFGTVVPGIEKSGNDVTFNATGSNENIIIGASIDGSNVFSLAEFNVKGTWTKINSINFNMNCNPAGSPSVCSYDFLTMQTRITVPIGTPAGSKTGVIIYTITGTPV
jgi:hypothetical protein